MTGSSLHWATSLLAGMNSNRSSDMIMSGVVDIFWLLGFIEAEGTFGLNALIPYFQLGQHARSQAVLNKIVEHLRKLPQGSQFTLNSAIPVVSSTLNSRLNVVTISIHNVDALYDYLMPALLVTPFQTRKGIDFRYWCIALRLYKWGAAYLPEGRSLLVAISRFINDGHYTTNPEAYPAPDESVVEHVLNLTRAVTRTPEMSQLEFAKAVARTVDIRTVFIYDNGVLLNDTLYSSYADAQSAIGLPRTSRAVSRHIDVGTLYRNRYAFYSAPRSLLGFNIIDHTRRQLRLASAISTR